MNPSIDKERILFRDENCIVVNKIPGEASEGAGPGMVSLPDVLAGLFGGGKTAGGKAFQPTAVHRIDVPVTGCALFARTPKALAYLNKQFAEGKTIKTYWAIIETPSGGWPLADEGELVHWLAVDPKRNKSFCFAVEGPGRQKAILKYKVLGRGEHYTFLEIGLITGRHHQIRAQLEAEGLHIKGDLKYGARRSEKTGGIRLHARSLSFPDPKAENEYIQVTAPLIRPDRLWTDFEECSAKAAS